MSLGVSIFVAWKPGEKQKEIEADGFDLIYCGMVAINRCFCWVPFCIEVSLCQVWGCPVALLGEIVH